MSARKLVEMMGERGIELAHTTILHWVQRCVPEFEKRWSRYAQTVGGWWRCDETYINVKGRWIYLYRAVDKQGRTVDFLLTAKRDVAAAKRFFQKARDGNGTPRVITLDTYAASPRAVRELKADLGGKRTLIHPAHQHGVFRGPSFALLSCLCIYWESHSYAVTRESHALERDHGDRKPVSAGAGTLRRVPRSSAGRDGTDDLWRWL